MNTNDLVKLESNIAFKKDYLNKTGWWKTKVIIPPVCFLFFGLAGLLYLLKVNMLISFYAIPFIAVFAIATIWFKALKRHIVSTKLGVPGSFLVCAGKSVATDAKYAYIVFVTGAKRHYEHYITKLAKELPAEQIDSAKVQAEKQAVKIEDEKSDTSFYLKAVKLSEIYKNDKNWEENDCLPVIFIDAMNVYVIKAKYISK